LAQYLFKVQTVYCIARARNKGKKAGYLIEDNRTLKKELKSKDLLKNKAF